MNSTSEFVDEALPFKNKQNSNERQGPKIYKIYY